MGTHKLLLIIILTILCGFLAKAQQTEIHQDPQRMFSDAVDLYERKVYASAQEMFGRILEQSGLVVELRSDAAFYYAASSYFLGNEDAQEQLIRFTEIHGASRHLNDAWFFISNIFFSDKRYKNAMDYYNKVEPELLAPELLTQYYFNKGYVMMMQEQYNTALQNFNRIRTNDDPVYYERATFYKAFIFYKTEKYQDALRMFTQLKNSKEFANAIPIYILDIHHRTGDYETVAQEGDAIYNATPKEKRPQIAAVIADAFFKIGDYDNAKKYFDLYKKNHKKMSRTQNYQLAYLDFLDEKYVEAIDVFTYISTANDAITQSCYYHIALSQLKLNKKKDAQKNFYLAYQMDFDAQIKEDALFNYAKLTYDLSYDPYKEAFKSLREFLEFYPSSNRIEEANQYIVNLAVSTKNYADAIAALELITNKTPEIRSTQQRLRYMYAVDLFSQKRFTQAIEWFEKAMESDAVQNMAAESCYWIAESYYRINRFHEAKKYYRQFAAMKEASALPYAKEIAYNLGYIAMNQGDYADAQTQFQVAIAQKQNLSENMLQDTYLRLADCYYISRSFGQALDYYTQAMNHSANNADYATYQKAMCYGAQKQFQDKITQLNSLITGYPSSPLNRDAVYEIGITLLLLDREQEALTYFDKIIKNYPRTTIALKSMLRKGQTLYNLNDSEGALSILKQVVAEYPNTPQSQEALGIIKNIYVDMNQPDTYIKYASGVPSAQISSDEKETMLFNGAEQLYLENKKGQAETALKTFLEEYPQGAYSNTARWYYADCALSAQQYDVALQEYETLILGDKTDYGKKSVLLSAGIYYRQQNFERALQRYRTALTTTETEQEKMDVALGIMRCNQHLNDFKALKTASAEVLQIKNLPSDIAAEAHLNLARAAIELKDYAEAEKEYTIVKNTATGSAVAEARYFLAWFLYRKKQYDQSMDAAFDLINDFPNEDRWMVKSFLLLADNYIALKNTFQAEQTLNSIIENCQIPELKAEAERKLEELRK
ncbi:MAG: tetratricopeptide repeat protein [Bacteroidales bacterium]|nr:tetratricopeptide repeat protein [Bacteroidales bacterium]